MVAHLAQNTPADQDPPQSPDGEDHAYEMIFDGGGSRAWADSTVDLLDVLISGYQAMSIEDRFAARLALALQVRSVVQAAINSERDLDGEPAGVVAALTHPDPTAPPVRTWASGHPLVVLDVHYRPFTEIQPPVTAGDGVLLWFKVEDEDDFLLSLHSAGYVSLGRRDL